MDAFFASVEQMDDPGLAGKPVIVGGHPERGVVSAASYEARVFGVRSAQPMVTARRLCPHGCFVKVRGRRYKELSDKVMAHVRDMAPVVEQTSIDEAYADITGTGRLYGPPAELGLTLKARILEDTGLRCSVGVAPNKYLAKICSDWDKPDGLFVLEHDLVADFLRDLPLGEIPGVGPKSLEVLERLGMTTCGHVRRRSLEFWISRLGEAGGRFILDRATGKGSAELTPYRDPKSMSAEKTFMKDEGDVEILEAQLWRQAERVGRELREKGFFGRSVNLKLRYADFTTLTRSRSLPEPTNATRPIYEAAAGLFHHVWNGGLVRLIGSGVSNLARPGRQMHLLAASDPGRLEELDKTIDDIKEKFGEDKLVSGKVFGASK
jgi:DNA polymerase-4